MKIGFTGTEQGMTQPQIDMLIHLLKSFPHGLVEANEFHHGDCVGADDQAHDIAVKLGYLPYVHPPQNPAKRAYKLAGIIFPQCEYLKRNHHIVDMTETMVACPESTTERFRGSGTWATIRYARSIRRNVYIIYPNGALEVT